jgi:hypothetical protein
MLAARRSRIRLTREDKLCVLSLGLLVFASLGFSDGVEDSDA